MAENTYIDTYAAIGNREDLIDIITMISPKDTVFYSRIGSAPIKASVHEWLTEELDAVEETNYVVEGLSASYASGDANYRSRITGYTQILRKEFSSSYTQDSTDKAGIAGTEFDHQRMLKTKSIARDINWHMINGSSSAGTSGAARKMNGLLASITTNVKSMTVNSIAQPLSQPIFNDALQLCWDGGGSPNAVYVNGFNKRVISGWTQPLNRNIDATGRKMVVAVDVYDGDFGRVEMVLDRHMSTSQVAIVEDQRYKKASLRPLFFEETAKVGGSRQGYVEAELTLEYRAEKSSAKITGTATA